MEERTINRLSDLTVKMLKDSPLSKVIKGYSGKVALVKVCRKWMVVPDINKLPEFVDFAWAFVSFGHSGRNDHERKVCREIAKCLKGKTYSLSVMAEEAPSIRI